MRLITKTLLYPLTALLLAGCATTPFNHTAADAPYAVPLQRISKAQPVVGLVLGAMLFLIAATQGGSSAFIYFQF